jgi:hypothetical protein
MARGLVTERIFSLVSFTFEEPLDLSYLTMHPSSTKVQIQGCVFSLFDKQSLLHKGQVVVVNEYNP